MVTKEAPIQEEVKVKRPAAAEAAPPAKRMKVPSLEEVRARIDAHIKSMEDELYTRMPDLETRIQPEFATLQPWWDLFVVGPFQPAGAFQSSNVIAVGDPAFIATLLVVNPAPIISPGISPLAILGGIPAQITYLTSNLNTMTPEPAITTPLPIAGVFSVDIQPINTAVAGIKELLVSAVIPGPGAAVWPFGGFASLLFRLATEPLLAFFGFPAPGVPSLTRELCRYSVYQPT
ncbi:MAG TPA: hypothetical protein VJL34_12325 [Anaerolineales bacterium]|nr:hypothetical protein [Anaerolineales bacterium]